MNLKYCLMVTGPAYGNQRSSIAFQFTKALIKNKHHINSIFFYHDGVYNANRLSTPANDEVNLVKDWHYLAQQHQISLFVCYAAAMRRGIINNELSQSLGYKTDNLQLNFRFGGLNQLAQAILMCNRFIQF